MISFASMQDWKQFERLCADLLQAEGFQIESEPSVDRTGTDFVATCEYRSHASDIPSIRVRWRVQCKHYAPSGNRLTRHEVEEALRSFQVVCGPDEGLLLMVSSDYTEPAKDVVDKFALQRPGVRVMLWNERQLTVLLDRHVNIQRRYGLDSGSPDVQSGTPRIHLNASGPVLFISDQSAIAHDCAAYLRAAGLEVVFLPHWNYSERERLTLIKNNYQTTEFGMCVCFLGDSFGLQLPTDLEMMVVQSVAKGTPLLLFPFSAWMIERGSLPRLSDFVPVRLKRLENREKGFIQTRQLAARMYPDFRNLLVKGGFEEDEYREYKPLVGSERFAIGIAASICISHTFEYLIPVNGARIAWADASGNPLLAVAENGVSRVAYLNSCCHSCLMPAAIPSPIRASTDFRVLFSNTVQWLLE
jgi:hypothetical protein